jgi:hypothetical protein
MGALKPIIFLMPVIALTLTAIMFGFLLKKSTDKPGFRKLSFTISILAFITNFIWEVIQIPLYSGTDDKIGHIAFCALAAIADTIMVLLLYFLLSAIYRNPFWGQHLTTNKALTVILIGGIGAIGAELFHVSAGNWIYAASMPIIPIVDVGLSPVLQFMILPLLIYYWSFRKLYKKIS